MNQRPIDCEQNAPQDLTLPGAATTSKQRTRRRRTPLFTGLTLILAPALCLGLYWQVNPHARPVGQPRNPAATEETIILGTPPATEATGGAPPFTGLTIFAADGGDIPYDPLAASGPETAFDQVSALEYEGSGEPSEVDRWGHPVVIVDGTVRAVLESPEAYESLRELLMAPYSQPIAGGKPWKRSFVNRVEVYYQSDAQGVVTVEEAQDLLAPLLEVRLREQLYRERDIPFETQRLEDDTLAEGEVRVASEGQNGVRQEVYEVVSVNGAEVERNLLGTRVTLPPVNRVEMVGTADVNAVASDTVPLKADGKAAFVVKPEGQSQRQLADDVQAMPPVESPAPSIASHSLAPQNPEQSIVASQNQDALPGQGGPQLQGSLQAQSDPLPANAQTQYGALTPEDSGNSLAPGAADIEALIPGEEGLAPLRPEGEGSGPAATDQAVSASLSPGQESVGFTSALAPQGGEIAWPSPSPSFSTFNYPTPGSSWYGNSSIGAGRQYPGVDKRAEDQRPDQGIRGPEASMAFAYPVDAEITSYFGWRSHKDRMHYGIDFGAKKGTPILASARGTVTWYTRDTDKGEYGKVVEINHGGGFTSIYAHCKSVTVREGDQVEQGDVIGYVGSTGSANGAHLHFEIRHDGIPYNPLLGYLEP